MKKSLFPLLLILCLSLQDGLAQEPKHEFRATWLATVENIDWPKTYITNASSRTQQQKELTDIFDKLVAGNMNAACMQVRSMCDAMYKSSYEPWSRALTDERGKDPGYDPLAFAIEEAHKRGLELHIWVNPFRVTSEGTIATDDLIWKNAGQWIIKYNNGSFSGQIIDPGYPEARAYVIKVLMEIVNNYDVDGIVMDDYFYPYGGTTTEDADSKSKYKPNNVVDVNQDGRTDDDWRRSNVDACLKALYDTIQSVKPWVRFGMGSFGIWSTQRKAAQAYGLTLPSGISGLDDYDVQACNPVEWVKNGYVDYINPQLYWSTNIAAQDYDVLCKWWAKDVCEHFSNQLPDGKKVHFFISQAAYHAYDGYKGYDAGVGEIQKQIDANRANLSSGYTGSVFYNTTAYCKMYDQLAQSHFSCKALPPAMDWKSKTALSAPANLTISGTTLTWEHTTASRFTLYVYPKNIPFLTAKANPIYLQQVVYGNSFNINGIDTITNNIAVCTYDRFGVEHKAAIYGDNSDSETKHEFRATWLTTAWGNDWPKTQVTNDATRKQQQDSLIAIFDRLQAGNMNAVCMQVRGRSDAFYQSSYEPWAAELAGARGKDPGYDPLAFAIEEAHKRGLELHAWVNPFRVTSSGTLDAKDLVKKNAGQWIIKYNNGTFTGEIIDPGYPEAREYVLNVLMEIISNYDIDGIVMDDYFYPYGGTTTEDAASKALHKPANVVDVNKDSETDDDWRRSNVDVFLKELYDRIQAKKPWVRFGMGTFGIWTTQTKVAQAYGISLPSGISGLDDYDVQACNPVEWVKNGYVDYINPQLYWPTTSTGQNYNKLCHWWARDVCEHFSNQLTGGKKVHFFSSQSISSNRSLTEIQAQVDANRNNLSSGYTGSVFFDTDAYLTMDKDLMFSRFSNHALTPPMDWKSNTALAAPTNLTVSDSTLTWQHATAERFTLYIYPKNIPFLTAKANPIYLQQVVYGNSFNINGIDTITNNIAVCTYDRFGVEHKAAIYGDNSDSESSPILGTIKWVLNEGEVNTTTVEVPSLAKLEEQFKNDYNRYFDASIGLNREISNFLYYGSPGNPNNDLEYLVYDMLNAQNSSWTWLRDYILAVSASNTTIQAALREGSDTHWRYSLSAFFTSNPSTRLEYAVDFSEYGQQFVWSSMYEIAHGAVLLLTYTTSPYTLPRPTHPEGFTFLGWYDNAAFAGSSLTAIPANWSGTLYAKWDIAPIRWQLNGGIVENIPMPAPTQEQLWAEFKVDANITMLDSLSTIKKEDRPMNTICSSLLADNVTAVYALSKWSWLKSYIQDVQHAQVGEIIVGIDGTTRTIAELNDDIHATNTTSTQWRYSTAAFFVQMQYDQYPATADFSTAGQPSVWGKLYQQTHTTDILPDSVTSTYVLPTPIHPDGYAFLGWSTKQYDIEFISEIDENFKGILYAIWDEEGGTSTSIENIKIDLTNTQMYDILGRPVGQNYKGVVIQNGKKYLLK